MAELLLQWLNHELQLSTHVTDMEVEFASGYLLGEILHRLNHQHNFADFMRSSSADAKIVNFCLLEPSLRNLNIKFDANVAAAIMNEKRDAAANLIYQIKMAAARVQRAPSVSVRSLERTGIFPLHNRPVKLAKPTFDSGNHRFFEHSIRRHVQSVAALQREKDDIAEAAMKRKAYLKEKAEEKEQLEITKAERLHRAFIHSSFIREALEETDSPAWRLALQKKNERETRRAAFFQQLIEKHDKAKEELAFSLRRQVKDGLDEFDGNGGSAVNVPGAKVPSRKSFGYGLRSLTTALGATSGGKKRAPSIVMASMLNERELFDTNNSEMGEALSVIKQQKQQREKRKENLARRRKRFVQECVYTHSRVGTARVTSILESVVLRGTNSEKSVRGEMDDIMVYKEIARENRALRNQEYENQQELDTAAAVDRDSSSYHRLLLRFEDDTEMQQMQQTRVQVSIEAAEHHLSALISGTIMKDMVEFVLFIAGKREETVYTRDPKVFLAPETWIEYKVQFAHGLEFGNDEVLAPEDGAPDSDLLDSHELERYLESFRPVDVPVTSELSAEAKVSSLSPWCPEDLRFVGAAEVIEDCFVLGEEVKYLRWAARTAPPPGVSLLTEEPENEQVVAISSKPTSTAHLARLKLESRRPLRILIFGPPFSGKATQAKLLGERHNLEVLSVQKLLQDVIQEGNDLGRQVEGILSNGSELPPELYSRLVIEATQRVERGSSSPTIDREERAADDKKAGWVIYDLPGTEQHGRNLEEQLTGYVDPALVPSPYDFESAIAPGRSKPALPSSFLHGKSGVDMVFYLGCATSTVIDRCLGQVEDEATGKKCHLVLNPPPDDSIVRHRLHHVNASAHSSELLSLHCLANDSFAHAQKAWYTKFQTLHEMPTGSGLTEGEIHEAMAAIVDAFGKVKDDEVQSQQLAREGKELELMRAEEERFRRLCSLQSAILEAQSTITSCEAAIEEAEEIKSKKEDVMELRQTLEDAQRQLETSTASAQSWAEEERGLLQTTSDEFSGELIPTISSILATAWDNMEAEYLSSMKASFALQREQRGLLADRAEMLTAEFCEFVRRPDQKQVVVNRFQTLFNEVIDEMRFDEPTKVELHARTDMLQDELGSLVDAKAAESEEELGTMLGDGWTEDTCQRIAVLYQMALQAECDRFRVSIQLLIDGYYAASSERSLLTSVVENWQAHLPHLELECKIYHDTAVDSSHDPTGAAGKGAPKARGKASVAVVTPPTGATTTGEEGPADSLSMDELLAVYEHILQRSDALMEAIAPSAASTADGTQKQVEANTSPSSDACAVNLLKGVRYEHDLLQRRVRFLQEATQTACDQVTRSMRSVESTLRDVLEDRKEREHAAVAALVRHIRAAIEAEVALPSFINITPEFKERFPTTAQLREDTMVRVEVGSRLFPRAPAEAPPTIEETHAVLLNNRQRSHLREALVSQSPDGSELLPLCMVVESMTALASLSDILPEAWRRCPAHVFAEIAAGFTLKQSSFVDIDAMLDAMCSREELLQSFLEEEEAEQQRLLQQQEEQRRRELEDQQRQQLEREQQEALGETEASDVVTAE